MNRKLNILLLDDNELEALSLKERLSSKSDSLDIILSNNIFEALTYLTSDEIKIDVILLDIFLAESKGLRTLHQIHSRVPRIPIIVLTNSSEASLAVDVLKAGAHDYLIKGEVGDTGVMRSIQRVMEKLQIFSDWRSFLDEAFIRATRDSLTNLPNRAVLQEHLHRAIAESKRHRELMGVMFIDLDDFKRVNDVYGHEVGDRLLALLGQRLSKMLRPEDMLARLGGDEFVLVVKRVTFATNMAILAEHLLEALKAPFLVRDVSISMTASIGISLFPSDATDAQDLINQADIAMFRVKKTGGCGYEFFERPKVKVYPLMSSKKEASPHAHNTRK